MASRHHRPASVQGEQSLASGHGAQGGPGVSPVVPPDLISRFVSTTGSGRYRSAVDLTFVTLAEEPQLRTGMWAVAGTWPEFMLHDPVASLFYPQLAETFPEHQIVGLTADGTVIARVNSVPFMWTGSDDDLPDRGWDAVLEAAFSHAHADGIRRSPCWKPGSHRATKVPG